jgi:hypothetical protein
MTWLNLSVNLTQGGKRLEALLQQLKLRQQEQERLQAEVVSVVREELKPREGSNLRDKRRRIEPIGTRPAADDGVAVAFWSLSRSEQGLIWEDKLYVHSTDQTQTVVLDLQFPSVNVNAPDPTPSRYEVFGPSGGQSCFIDVFDYGYNGPGIGFQGSSGIVTPSSGDPYQCGIPRFGSITYYDFQLSGTTSGTYRIIPLPLGQDQMFLVFVRTLSLFRNYSTSEVLLQIEQFGTFAGDGIYGFYDAVLYYYFQYPEATQYFQLDHTYEVRVVKVGKSSVQEIGAPDGLRQAIEKIIPSAVKPVTTGNIREWDFYAWDSGVNPGNKFPLEVGLRTEELDFDRLLLTNTTGILGAGFNVSGFLGSDIVPKATPVVYPALLNGDDPAEDWPDIWSPLGDPYEYVTNAIRPKTHADTGMDVQYEEASDVPGKDRLIRMVQANKEYHWAVQVNNQFVNPVFTWDHGNSAYCRQQLLRLGFSPEDLTP